jgi:UDP-N-acetylglucosamine:LPS N-acetylglucosamine transferase
VVPPNEGTSSKVPPGYPHVLLVASTGGHLAQLVALRECWSQWRRTWVTFDKADARSSLDGEQVVLAHHPTTRNLPNAVRNLRLAREVVPRLRPDVLVTTGAGVAAPFVAAAVAHRVPVVYVEVVDRITTRTLTGRMCRPFVDSFVVQWDDQRTTYPGSDLVGVLM